MSRRAHIKRAKILRNGDFPSTLVKRMSESWWQVPYRTLYRRTRKAIARAQAMRGYYHR